MVFRRTASPLLSAGIFLVLALAIPESHGSLFYRVPYDGDCCHTYRFSHTNPWIARFLSTMFGPLPCQTGQVINAEGECVDRDELTADRCRDPFRFDQKVVNRICSRQVTAKFADPKNCTWYYDCMSSSPDKHVTCPAGLNFDDVNKTCRLATEVMCGQRPVNYTQAELQAMCTADPSRKIIRTDNCNGYYNCSKTSDPTGRFLPFNDECPYLSLVDPETKECKPFSQVTCDLRKTIKRPCDLDQNRCTIGHCRDCEVDHPDCSNEPDGNRPIRNQEFTPRYAKCQKGWTMGVGTCEPRVNARGLRETEVFHARKLECTPITSVPRSLGGLGPEEDDP